MASVHDLYIRRLRLDKESAFWRSIFQQLNARLPADSQRVFIEPLISLEEVTLDEADPEIVESVLGRIQQIHDNITAEVTEIDSWDFDLEDENDD